MTGDNDKIGPLPTLGGVSVWFISSVIHVIFIVLLLLGYRGPLLIGIQVVNVVIILATFLGDYARRRDGG